MYRDMNKFTNKKLQNEVKDQMLLQAILIWMKILNYLWPKSCSLENNQVQSGD